MKSYTIYVQRVELVVQSIKCMKSMKYINCLIDYI